MTFNAMEQKPKAATELHFPLLRKFISTATEHAKFIHLQQLLFRFIDKLYMLLRYIFCYKHTNRT